MYRTELLLFLAEIWPKKITSRDGCVLLIYATLVCNLDHRQSFWPLISNFSGHLDGQNHSLQTARFPQSKRKFMRNSAERVLADGAIQVAAQP